MNKKLTLISILFLAVAIFAGYVLVSDKKDSAGPSTVVEQAAIPSNQGAAQETNGVILFYGDGCPHCALVEEYMSQNDVEAKVPFVQKEVYYNKQNASELAEKAAACGIPTNSIGVPFLWDGAACLVGDQPIIDFFKAKINQQ